MEIALNSEDLDDMQPRSSVIPVKELRLDRFNVKCKEPEKLQKKTHYDINLKKKKTENIKISE